QCADLGEVGGQRAVEVEDLDGQGCQVHAAQLFQRPAAVVVVGEMGGVADLLAGVLAPKLVTQAIVGGEDQRLEEVDRGGTGVGVVRRQACRMRKASRSPSARGVAPCSAAKTARAAWTASRESDLPLRRRAVAVGLGASNTASPAVRSARSSPTPCERAL